MKTGLERFEASSYENKKKMDKKWKNKARCSPLKNEAVAA